MDEPGYETFIETRGTTRASTLLMYEGVIRRIRRASPAPLLELNAVQARKVAHALKAYKSAGQLGAIARMFLIANGRSKDDAVVKAFSGRILKNSKTRLSTDEVATPDTVQRMIAASTSLRDRTLWAVLWETGARLHEVLALNVSDVKRMDLPGNHGRHGYRVELRKVKVAGEERNPLLIEAVPFVDAWLAAYPAGVAEPRPLFPTFKGRLVRTGAWAAFRDCVRRAKLSKELHPHSYRHGRATHLLRSGLTEAQVKKALGWVPSSAMLGRYSHLTTEDSDDALLRMNGLATGRVEPARLAPVETAVPAMPEQPTNIIEQARAAAADEVARIMSGILGSGDVELSVDPAALTAFVDAVRRAGKRR